MTNPTKKNWTRTCHAPQWPSLARRYYMVIYLTHVKTVTETRAIWTYSFYKNFWDLLLVVGCEGPAIKTDIRLLLSPLTFSKILPYYYKYHTLILEQPALIWSLDEQSLPPGVELQATGTIPIGKFSGYGKKKKHLQICTVKRLDKCITTHLRLERGALKLIETRGVCEESED